MGFILCCFPLAYCIPATWILSWSLQPNAHLGIFSFAALFSQNILIPDIHYHFPSIPTGFCSNVIFISKRLFLLFILYALNLLYIFDINLFTFCLPPFLMVDHQFQFFTACPTILELYIHALTMWLCKTSYSAALSIVCGMLWLMESKYRWLTILSWRHKNHYAFLFTLLCFCYPPWQAHVSGMHIFPE